MTESKIKLLFVDDDETILKIISKYFSKKDYEVITASNGEEGFNKAKKYKPLLIVSDLMMPKMDGFEFCKSVREDSELHNIPFIMLTARETKESFIKGFEVGANDYIIKPFKMIELSFKVQSFVTLQKNAFQIQKYKEKEKVSEELLEIISHELRTPLTAIKASVETILLSQDNQDFTKNDLIQFLNIIDEESDRLNRVLNDIFVITEQKKKILKLNKEKNNIIDIVNTSINRVNNFLTNKKQSIITSFESNNNLIFGDEKLLSDVFYYILNNAIKFSAENKKIIINSYNKENYVCVDIVDEGCGMEADELNQIFDKFYLKDSSINRVNTGLGIGLTISKTYIDLHEGKIEVFSKKNQGTKVTVSLPLGNK
jgi:two-component system, sensor histidine kinase and response regulator